MAIFGKKTKSEKKASAGRARATTLKSGSAHDTLRAPWFSEKSLIITEKNVYVFSVPARATKAEIAGAVKEVYGVAPRKVSVAGLPAKSKALRTRRGVGTRAARRKAYVYLNAGDKIQFV